MLVEGAVIEAAIMATAAEVFRFSRLVSTSGTINKLDDVAGLADGLGPTMSGGLDAGLSPWDMGWSSRGLAIEETLGGNLPRSFPTIDAFSKGTATSIKSIDLTAATYQNAGRLNSRLKGYVTFPRFSGQLPFGVLGLRERRSYACTDAFGVSSACGRVS